MNSKIDTLEVKRAADLLTLASSVTSLELKSSSGGGEYKGPCPFCGGKDRFSLQPNHQPEARWLCRNCTNGDWKDAIEFGRRLWPGLKFRETCEALTGGNAPALTSSRPVPQPEPAAVPPGDDWQETGLSFVDVCEAALWKPGGARALDYLRKRGLRDETIKHFRLGYNPTDRRDTWRNGEVFIDRGISIPCFIRGRLWYVKIRRPVGDPKYRLIKGSRPEALFNADLLDTSDVALFVEGEFDCMLAWQEIGDQLPVSTVGAAKYSPDLAVFGRYLIGKKASLICYDADKAGDKGTEKIMSLLCNPVLAPLPDGEWKDITDFYQAGGDLRAWIANYLDFYDPLGAGGMIETARALGGVAIEVR